MYHVAGWNIHTFVQIMLLNTIYTGFPITSQMSYEKHPLHILITYTYKSRKLQKGCNPEKLAPTKCVYINEYTESSTTVSLGKYFNVPFFSWKFLFFVVHNTDSFTKDFQSCLESMQINCSLYYCYTAP